MAVTNYIWDELSDSVLMETDGSGATTAVYTQEPGPFGGLISERRGNQSRYYHYDGLGSTRQLTDATGQVTDTYLYDAFGSTVQSTGTNVVPYHFVGRSGYYYDQELAEYYIRARHYDPRLARWLALDPIGYKGKDFNLYRYVGDSPLTGTDPTGTIRPAKGEIGCVAFCLAWCKDRYAECLDDGQKELETCLDAAKSIRDPKERQAAIDNCENTAYLGIAECGIKFMACGLSCLLPWGPRGPRW